MRHYIICIFLFTAIGSQAQQINPVPDYVFRNQMSVGRNAVTDTAAYISIGPRYGANKGLMPPIVSDTAAITGVKRNGLLIFSVQRNNFQYWDSINSRWTSVTANVDTTIISTRAWRKKGDDSLGAVIATKVNISDTATMLNPYTRGSGTTNYLPKFTGSRTLGNSLIFDNATQVGVNTNGPAYTLDVNGTFRSANGSNFATTSGQVAIGTATTAGKVRIAGDAFNANTQTTYALVLGNPNTDYSIGADASYVYHQSWNSKAMLLNNLGNNTIINPSSGSVSIGNTSPSYKLDITGTLRSTGNTFLGTSSSEVYVNTTTDVGDYRLQVNGNANFRDDVLIDTNLRVNRHISLDQTPKAWALGNAIEGPQGSTLFVAGGGVQTLANVYYDGSYKYSTSNPGAAMFLLQSGITFATYGSGTANGALTGANEMVYAGGELRVGIADQGTFKLQVADKSYFGDEVQIASTTDLGNYKLQVTGEAIITAGIRTDAPSGGTAATWKLGTVATVSPTSPNRTIEVEIGGTTYYIHAKTTNN